MPAPTKPVELSRFTRFAKGIARASGHPLTFAIAGLLIVVWAATGSIFNYSDTWQLVINTGTTIVTFLMVFLIQNTQNRDSQAVQVKLDELIRAMEGAHNAMLGLEDLDEKELDRLREKYAQLALKARKDVEAGRSDTNAVVLEEINASKAASVATAQSRKRRAHKT